MCLPRSAKDARIGIHFMAYLSDSDLGPLFQLRQNTVESVVNRKCKIDKLDHKENESGYRTILLRLVDGPLSTLECESIVHRGQAFIRSLRRDGHVIHTKRIDGVPTYVYEGRVAVVKSTPMIRHCYYRTKHWVEISKARKQFDGFKCVQCNSTEKLETHHLRYNLFEESLEFDLLTLCRNCHVAMHEAASGSRSMHFPLTITPEQLRRIQEEYPEVSE